MRRRYEAGIAHKMDIVSSIAALSVKDTIDMKGAPDDDEDRNRLVLLDYTE